MRQNAFAAQTPLLGELIALPRPGAGFGGEKEWGRERREKNKDGRDKTL